LTPEEGQTLFSLQSMPQKIHINSSDIGSVSVMNKLISDNFQVLLVFTTGRLLTLQGVNKLTILFGK